jgi:hypothetical protein
MAWLAILAAGVFVGPVLLRTAKAQDQPLDQSEDLSLDWGPTVVILRELENEYEPVPFDHLSHAKMAQMWNGCVTCHHYSPHPTAKPTDHPSTLTITGPVTQEASIEIPACKSCHPIGADESEIHMPSLKGAYHRQCLNCHKEWMHENACVICHEPKEGRNVAQNQPAPGDIVGRMHPPIPEPDDVVYRTRFTPADGGNVLFRHQGHTVGFGIRCVDCHHQDNCAHCHGATGDTTAQKPLHPGMTWDESHGPCMGCHRDNRCQHCHYKDGQLPPPAFDHRDTDQELDEDHASLACVQCHLDLDFEQTPTCGDAACHEGKQIEYPTELPGPVVSTGLQSTETTDVSTGKNGP